VRISSKEEEAANVEAATEMEEANANWLNLHEEVNKYKPPERTVRPTS
jgi:hypothetical protein